MERVKDSSEVRIEGHDFKDFDDKFIIYNVPVVAELVQQYGDGFAFKPISEVRKIKVDNVPITMRVDVPSHPKKHLSESNTDEKASVTVGFMSEISNPKDGMSNLKRYADMVFFKNDITKVVLDKYVAGDFIDTSIGFNFMKDTTSGVFDGVSYDYVQRNILLDHNAILLDGFGRAGVGRMPSPIGGIGADQNDAFTAEVEDLVNNLVVDNPALDKKDVLNLVETQIWKIKEKTTDSNKKNKLEVNKMVDKNIDALESQLKKVTDERDSAIKELKTKNDSLVKEAQEKVKKEIDSLKKGKDEADKKFKEVSVELKKYKDVELEELEKKRDALIEDNEDYKELFEKADADLIKSYHEKLLEKQKNKGDKGRNISIDMMGTGKNSKAISEAERMKQWINPKKKDGD